MDPLSLFVHRARSARSPERTAEEDLPVRGAHSDERSETSRAEAKSLVERFFRQRRARGQTAHVDQSQAIALVERFKAQAAKRGGSADQRGAREAPHESHIGVGRVALVLKSVGPTPIMIVKWLCENCSYPLQDAIIATQNVPVVLRRDDQFVELERQRQALLRLGAQVKLQT